LVARRRICTRSYVQRAQLGRECTIFKCVTTTRLCHLQGILPKLALLAYIDTLVVQPKRTHNKSVVHLKNTRDRRPLAVSNQKSWNAALSFNFIAMTKNNIIPLHHILTTNSELICLSNYILKRNIENQILIKSSTRICFW